MANSSGLKKKSFIIKLSQRSTQNSTYPLSSRKRWWPQMEESERVCKGAHGVGWQSLVPLDLRLCRATSVGNVVKCGINTSKRLGRPCWPQFPLLLHYQTLLNHSDLRDDPWASPAHTGPDERPPRRTPGPQLLGTLRKQVSVLRPIWPFPELTLTDLHSDTGKI